MKTFDKVINPEMYKHCLNCSIYQAHVNDIAAQYPPNTILNLKEIQPNCIWYIEHILNGDSNDSIECPWFDDVTKPQIPFQ